MMHLVFLFATAVVGLAPQAARDRPLPPTPAGSAVISGGVTTEVNGEPQPVRRAKVTLESTALTEPRHVDSDIDGRYRVDGLPDGAYRVRAEKAGFVPRVRDARRAFEPAAPVTVGAGQSLTMDLPMVRGAALEGRITTTTGAPAVNVIVSALRMGYDANGRRPVPVRQARTDDRGMFRVHTLPAGEYYLEAAPDPLQQIQQAPVPGQPASILERTYFPGAPQVEGGRTIPLSAGQNVADLTFALPSIPTAALQGRVVDSTGRAPAAMGMRIQRVGGPLGEVRGSANPDGNDFVFPRVPAGDYWLTGVSRASSSAPLEFGVLRLSVAGQDLTGLVIPTTQGSTVNGRVTAEGAPLPAGVSLHVSPHSTAFLLPAVFGESAPVMPAVPVGAEGVFTFPNLFGPTLLRVDGLPRGWALKSVTLDGEDVTDAPVDLRASDRPRDARVLVTARTAAVSGAVRDENAQTVSRARVVVFSEDASAWGWRSRVIHSVEGDDTGRYVIEGLLPGKYRVVAVPFLEDGSWKDASILARLLPLSVAMTFDEPTRTTLDLVVKPW
jgi:hypothetical protein